MSEHEIIKILITAFKKGRKVLIAGNGGSASQASHFAGEFLCKYKLDRKPLPAIPLSDHAVITAIGNDYGFKYVFSRQVEALGKRGDVFIALSTSGKSANLIEAIKVAKRKGLVVIDFSTLSKVPKKWEPGSGLKDVGIVQGDQLYLMHYICEKVEAYFAKGSSNYFNWGKT